MKKRLFVSKLTCVALTAVSLILSPVAAEFSSFSPPGPLCALAGEALTEQEGMDSGQMTTDEPAVDVIETDPAPAMPTEPVPEPAETDPLPMETDPQPAETDPQLAETYPQSTEADPQPAETNPLPVETIVSPESGTTDPAASADPETEMLPEAASETPPALLRGCEAVSAYFIFARRKNFRGELPLSSFLGVTDALIRPSSVGESERSQSISKNLVFL